MTFEDPEVGTAMAEALREAGVDTDHAHLTALAGRCKNEFEFTRALQKDMAALRTVVRAIWPALRTEPATTRAGRAGVAAPLPPIATKVAIPVKQRETPAQRAHRLAPARAKFIEAAARELDTLKRSDGQLWMLTQWRDLPGLTADGKLAEAIYRFTRVPDESRAVGEVLNADQFDAILAKARAQT